MAVDLTLKSTAVAAMETLPLVANNPGAGAVGIVKSAYGYIASVTAALSVTSVIRLARVPANAIIKSVKVSSGAQAAGKFDIGVYRTPGDGSAAVDQDFFTTDLDCASAVVDTECLMLATSANTPAKRNQPLWQAAGLSADPGGSLDICATVHTTAVTTGTGALAAEVLFV